MTPPKHDLDDDLISLLTHSSPSQNHPKHECYMKNHNILSFVIQIRRSIQWVRCLSILFLMTSGCVSLPIPGGKVERAKNISYQKPGGSFKQLSADSLDQAWQSSHTGNTIAYISECNSPVETSLKALETESLGALSNPTIVKSETKPFNDRESTYTQGDGTVDGVPVSVAILVFQKNGCNYTLTYSGRKSAFATELPAFEAFKESFKVP